MNGMYHCLNPACDAETYVQEWPATRTDPAESTWGDGCAGCGEELNPEPELTGEELTGEAAIARAEAAADAPGPDWRDE